MNKQPIGQTIIKRKYNKKQVGDPGFINFSELKESDEEFIARVTAEANSHYECILNITYLNEDTAIIIWKDVSYKENSSALKAAKGYLSTEKIRVERYRDYKTSTGFEPYEIFRKRVENIANTFNNTEIKYIDSNTAIITVFI